MSAIKVGDRVGCILDHDGHAVRFFGYGVYRGMFIPGPDAVAFAAMCRDAGRANPKIELDTGEVVWGGECWWAAEEQVRRAIQHAVIIPAFRSDLEK